MSKEKLIDTIEGDFTSRSAAERAVDTVIDGIERVVRGGDTVILRGFGAFQAKDRKARTGRNIHTGAPLDIAARRVMTFRSKVQF